MVFNERILLGKIRIVNNEFCAFFVPAIMTFFKGKRDRGGLFSRPGERKQGTFYCAGGHFQV
jgi:hypothetical protein